MGLFGKLFGRPKKISIYEVTKTTVKCRKCGRKMHILKETQPDIPYTKRDGRVDVGIRCKSCGKYSCAYCKIELLNCLSGGVGTVRSICCAGIISKGYWYMNYITEEVAKGLGSEKNES
jgi:ribosomal protein L37E